MVIHIVLNEGVHGRGTPLVATVSLCLEYKDHFGASHVPVHVGLFKMLPTFCAFEFTHFCGAELVLWTLCRQ